VTKVPTMRPKTKSARTHSGSGVPAGVVVPRPLSKRFRVAAWVTAWLIRCVAATLRARLDDQTGLLEGPHSQRGIFCIWHNRLALVMPCYHRFVRTRDGTVRDLAAIVSASKDGGVVAQILRQFGAIPVRGSSSRRGPQALLELTTMAERGCHLAITPDGPRGPRYVVQEGVVALSQVTGLPIIPANFYLSWKWSVGSWDAFQVPLPFARWDVVFGAPLRVPKEASEEERERLRQELQERMLALTRD